MKFDSIITLLLVAIIAGAGILVAHNYLTAKTESDKRLARDSAVEGCMQVATYSWQAANHANPAFTDTTVEPNRYWYHICMQEKGYDVISEL